MLLPTQLLLIAAALATVAAVAEVAQHSECPEEDTAAAACAVHEVRIEGCRSWAKGVCKVRRGSTPVISFDYTPQFAATAAHGQVYWMSPEGDLPFAGMLTDACQHTACPLASGQRQTYSYNFETSRKYMVKTYDIKWKLSDPDTQKTCCFQTQINLVK